jgi:hypothetical protein
MWLVNPEYMCTKHLIAEHAELHTCLGAMLRQKSMKGYIENNLLEPSALSDRHKQLRDEMLSRGFKHNSVLLSSKVRQAISLLPEEYRSHLVDKKSSLKVLLERCAECKKLYLGRSK